MRPSKLAVGEAWTKKSQRALLGDPVEETLRAAEQRSEKDRAFDLLDALSCSGAIPLEACSLHAVVAATHCFDSSLMDTVVVKNVNPIEKLERSSLIVASTIQDAPAEALLCRDEIQATAALPAPPLHTPPSLPSSDAASLAAAHRHLLGPGAAPANPALSG